MTGQIAATTAAPALAGVVDGEARYIMGTYRRQQVALMRGDGIRVWDTEGREYLDMVAGIAVNLLGHSAGVVSEALAAQSRKLVHASNLYYTEPQVELARTLVETAFPSRVFLCNSGTEASEAAIKIARLWGGLHRNGASGIVCAQGSFHGRTLGALAATGVGRYREPFAPMPDGFVHVAYDDVHAVAEAVDETTAAVFLEPIQGENGVLPMSDATLAGIRMLCDERNVLLMLDEAQTGMGRTGTMWAHQHSGIVPDVMTVAKGLGGGVPIGAVLANARADVFAAGDHGSTFGGNPLASTVAIAVLRAIAEDGLVANAARIGRYLETALVRLVSPGGLVESVRGRGLMLALQLSEDLAPDVVRAALGVGLIVNATGPRTLRLVPPLTVTEDDCDAAVARLGEALELARSAGGS